MPYYGQKLAIKLKFYGKLVRMAKKCYHFLNVLFSPQILSHHKAKSVGECQRMSFNSGLRWGVPTGDPKVHSALPLHSYVRLQPKVAGLPPAKMDLIKNRLSGYIDSFWCDSKVL